MTIGLGGYVSLKVTTGLLTRKVDVSYEINLCLVIASAGVTVIICLTIVFFQIWRVRRRIGKITLKGMDLLERTRQNIIKREPQWEHLEREYEVWNKQAEDWLKINDYTAYFLFKNEAGLVATQGYKVIGGKEGLLCKLDVKLARLAEITTQRL